MPFTGRATWDMGNVIAEDLAPVVSIISPSETPLLNILGDPPYISNGIYHEWVEDALSATRVVIDTSVASDTSDTAIGIASSAATYLRVGSILMSNTTNEYMRVLSVSGNTITVSRAFGSTAVGPLASGDTIEVLFAPSPEGSDVLDGRSAPKKRRGNLCQIFKKDVIVSGSAQAVKQVANIQSQKDDDIQKRLREALRDLERSAILSIPAGTTSGQSDAYRTMGGLRYQLVTNRVPVGTLTESSLGNALKACWDNGGIDINLILCDINFKRIIDSWNSSRIVIGSSDTSYISEVTQYASSFGTQKIVASRWMPPMSACLISTARTKVLPLRGRSFGYEDVSKTGDSFKGMVVGEYTLELMNEEGMAWVSLT